jgi:hypothetical protein
VGFFGFTLTMGWMDDGRYIELVHPSSPRKKLVIWVGI